MKKAGFLLLMISLYAVLPAAAQKNESVLWQISGNGLPKPSWMLGTMHTVSQSLLDSFPALYTLMSSCEFGLFEKGGSPIGEVKDTAIYTPPLDSVFTKEEYTLVDSFFTHSPFGSIRPHNKEASLMAMLQAVLLFRANAQQQMSFDDFIHTLMLDSMHKKTFQLDETGQMAREAQPFREEAKLLVTMIKDTTITNNDFNYGGIFDYSLYCKSLTQNMLLNAEPAEIMKHGAEERDFLWIPKIIKKMRDGQCFIAVGLGHLQFKTGLIQLLRTEGFAVEPVPLSKKQQQ